jgi:hypothetical protein
MTRINALRSTAKNSSVAWGKETWGKNTSALIFAAVLIICSVTVGCSKDQPKPISSNTQIPVTQTFTPAPPAPVMQAENKPAPKKVVHKKPATVNYTDKDSGVTFEYPRRYAIETGSAATDLLESSPIPMNFVAPGGVALAAVELPESSYVNTDFSSAFFDVSVHKALTADQCTEFAVPQPKIVEAKSVESQVAEIKPAETNTTETKPTEVKTAEASAPETKSNSAQSSSDSSGSKLLLGDLELRATEAVSGEGSRQSDSKYFHVFQNGSCYEFALNVTTVASADGLIKHVDRDRVFSSLEKILATVKINPVMINPVATPEVTAEAPATPPVPETPAQ